MELKEKVGLVTGGTKGIGAASAIAHRSPLFLFQLALFDIHIFEFAGVKDFAAFQAFDKLRVFFAGNYANAGMLAFSGVGFHRGRLCRAG